MDTMVELSLPDIAIVLVEDANHVVRGKDADSLERIKRWFADHFRGPGFVIGLARLANGRLVAAVIFPDCATPA